MKYTNFYSINEDLKDAILQLLFKSNESIINLMETVEKLPVYGRIEAFIFNFYLSKILLKKINPNLFNEIKKDYDSTVIASLKELKLDYRVPDVKGFVNNRISFFTNELESMQMNENWLPSRLYYVFYENPLTDNPRPSVNFLKFMKFNAALLAMMNSMKQSIEIIDNQYNLYKTN